MPIYNYKCEKCNNEFELVVFDKDKVIVCPECESKSVVKMFSSPTLKNRLRSKHHFDKNVKPQIDNTVKRISNNSDNDFLDIYGSK